MRSAILSGMAVILDIDSRAQQHDDENSDARARPRRA
jgi:hypothetical protein